MQLEFTVFLEAHHKDYFEHKYFPISWDDGEIFTQKFFDNHLLVYTRILFCNAIRDPNYPEGVCALLASHSRRKDSGVSFIHIHKFHIQQDLIGDVIIFQ